MSQIIFSPEQLTFMDAYFKKSEEKKFNGQTKLLTYIMTLDDLKNFKSAPSGMKWTADEKTKFEKLGHVEKKKYLINKMGFNGGVILPHLTLDTIYKYPNITDATSKSKYDDAMNTLSSSNRSFKNMDRAMQDNILNNLRYASNKNNLIASKELADLLFERVESIEESQGIKDIKESLDLYNKLIKAGAPDGYYGYYAIYRFTVDRDKLSYSSLTPSSLGLNEETAAKYLNEAIKMGQKQALYDLAETTEGSSMAVDMYITAGYLYQDRNAFEKAMRSASYGINSVDFEIFYIACMRMAIMLGGKLDELISCYSNGVSVHNNPARVNQLRQYARSRKLIDGLDPYFDETFPPDLVLDFGTELGGGLYGGSSNTPGIYFWIKKGKMKDPRDKDSTKQTVQDFYNKLWQIILWHNNYTTIYLEEETETYFDNLSYTAHLLYRKYPSGFASARPYIFPQDVLATKIDYNKVPPRDMK